MRWSIYEAADYKYAVAIPHNDNNPQTLSLLIEHHFVTLNFSVILNADTDYSAVLGYKSLKF